MLQSLYDTIYNLLNSELFISMINNFSGHKEVLCIIVLSSCVLILLTVSFAFKFLLKLVER